MNIFYLDHDPVKCAQYSCDQHVCKMVTETAQILSTVYWEINQPLAEVHYADGKIYKAVKGMNHKPINWAKASRDNFDWLVLLGLALADEYTARYGRVHAARRYLEWCAENPAVIASHGFTQPPQSMPEALQRPDAVEGNRQFYIVEKSKFARWLHSEPPVWYINGVSNARAI